MDGHMDEGRDRDQADWSVLGEGSAEGVVDVEFGAVGGKCDDFANVAAAGQETSLVGTCVVDGTDRSFEGNSEVGVDRESGYNYDDLDDVDVDVPLAAPELGALGIFHCGSLVAVVLWPALQLGYVPVGALDCVYVVTDSDDGDEAGTVLLVLGSFLQCFADLVDSCSPSAGYLKA